MPTMRPWHFFVLLAFIQYDISTVGFCRHFIQHMPYGHWWHPYFFTIAPLIFTAVVFWRYKADQPYRWQLKGLCQHCGYDLRASKERCPECGNPINPETTNPSHSSKP